jgi:hypothetical protein
MVIAVHANSLSDIRSRRDCAKCHCKHVDFPLYTNISHAMFAAEKNGAQQEKVVLLTDLDILQLKPTESLYIIGHGTPGMLGDMAEDFFTPSVTFLDGEKTYVGINDYLGGIKNSGRVPPFRAVEIYACHGGVELPRFQPSLVAGAQQGLSEAGLSHVKIKGFKGYSYSNPYLDDTRVLNHESAKGGATRLADDIQDELLSSPEYHDMLLHIDRFVKFNPNMPIAEKAEKVSMKTKDFYDTLIKKLDSQNLLYPVNDRASIVSLTSMSIIPPPEIVQPQKVE